MLQKLSNVARRKYRYEINTPVKINFFFLSFDLWNSELEIYSRAHKLSAAHWRGSSWNVVRSGFTHAVFLQGHHLFECRECALMALCFVSGSCFMASYLLKQSVFRGFFCHALVSVKKMAINCMKALCTRKNTTNINLHKIAQLPYRGVVVAVVVFFFHEFCVYGNTQV